MADIESMQRTDDIARKHGGKDANLSPDGKWKSFPRVPNLLRYVPNGMFYGRTKVNGEVVRRKLDTTVFTTAKLRLADFLKDQGNARTECPAACDTFKDARLQYARDLENTVTLAAATRRYRDYCIKALLASWQNLDEVKLQTFVSGNKDAVERCKAWHARLAQELDEQYFNNVLGTFKAVLKAGGIEGARNPLKDLKRLGVKPTEIKLPEPEQFARLLELVETSGARQAQACADFIRLLAFTGCRLSEARQIKFEDLDFSRGTILVHNAKTRGADNAPLTRTVPMIAEARELFARLKQHAGTEPTGAVSGVGECEKSLARACKLLKLPRLTHHDLRHLFATRCIETGVDTPTVSRWLGHRDGGALAMRVYGHLRDDHSQAMAQKVTFNPARDNVVPMTKEVA
jgi:integrase